MIPKMHHLPLMVLASAASLTLGAPGNAAAQERERFLGYGLGIEAGIGLSDFFDSDTAVVTSAGFNWDARAIFGTRTTLALEAAYLGSTHDVDTPGLEDGAFLVSNGLEAAARFHFARFALAEEGASTLRPYLLGGLAWRNWDLVGADTNTSNVNESDNVLEIPIGAGLDWRFGRVLLDQRFVYRPTIGSDLFSPVDGVGQRLGSWAFTLRGGFEF